MPMPMAMRNIKLLFPPSVGMRSVGRLLVTVAIADPVLMSMSMPICDSILLLLLAPAPVMCLAMIG